MLTMHTLQRLYIYHASIPFSLNHNNDNNMRYKTSQQYDIYDNIIMCSMELCHCHLS